MRNVLIKSDIIYWTKILYFQEENRLEILSNTKIMNDKIVKHFNSSCLKCDRKSSLKKEIKIRTWNREKAEQKMGRLKNEGNGGSCSDRVFTNNVCNSPNPSLPCYTQGGKKEGKKLGMSSLQFWYYKKTRLQLGCTLDLHLASCIQVEKKTGNHTAAVNGLVVCQSGRRQRIAKWVFWWKKCFQRDDGYIVVILIEQLVGVDLQIWCLNQNILIQ